MYVAAVSTEKKYLEKLEALQLCDHCQQPVYRLRRRGMVEVRSQGHFNRLDAAFEQDDARETSSPVGNFSREDAAGVIRQATLAIDTRDCIGCEVCVARCGKGVLRMIDGKALIDLRQLNHCDLDGECVEVCPTNVVTLNVQRATPPAELTPAEARSFGEEIPRK